MKLNSTNIMKRLQKNIMQPFVHIKGDFYILQQRRIGRCLDNAVSQTL